MTSYYATTPSHRSHHHEPVIINPSHRSHGTPYVASGSHVYSSHAPTTVYGGGGDAVYVTPSSHGHGSRHYSTVPTTAYSDGRHHRRSRHRSHGYSEGHHLTLGERIRRFFGLGPKHHNYKHKSRSSSWGFLGRSRRRRYVDARTGAEVDRHGRPVYRV